MGGYVAGPPVLAALMRGVPVVVMEPNAVPGVTNRWIARWVRRALISFEETARFFPPDRTELTGLPVREEFFSVPAERAGRGVHGADYGRQPGLANAERSGAAELAAVPASRVCPCGSFIRPGPRCMRNWRAEFAETGLSGEVVPFIGDMPAAFAQADLIVCRSGAGAVSELAAAGKPSMLVPFPFAADEHQMKNAEAVGARGRGHAFARQRLDGAKFFETVARVAGRSAAIARDGRSGAKTGAAGCRAAGCGNID